MPDYSNLAMVKDGVVSLDPVIPNLYGLEVWQLGDEWTMTQFDFLAEGRRWYPIVDRSPPLQRYQSYEGDAVLSYTTGDTVVASVRAIRDWTAQEIHDWKASTPRHITKLAFRNRFTQPEKIAFEMAMIDDPAASQANREVAASLRVMEKDLDASPPPYVDMNSPFVQSMIHQRETLGLIAAGRADEIIWADIEPNEVP